MPVRDASVAERPLIDFSSGYVRRSIDAFPKQGDREPWRLNQNYVLDTLALKYGRVAGRHAALLLMVGRSCRAARAKAICRR